MRQVPHYLIIGNGRVARHFQHYFTLLNISYSCWHRNQAIAQLTAALPVATHILILIRDDAIEVFIAQYLAQTQAIIVHFSGSLVTDKAYGAHPLMTFVETLYELPQYQALTFIIDHDAPTLAKLLPGLPNQAVTLHKTLKPKYHALCVLSGNFSCLLWQKLLTTLETEFQIPASCAHPYLIQQTQNLLSNYKTALTGPLVRGDQQTLTQNMAALNNDAMQQVYASFVAAYAEMQAPEESTHECI